MHSFPQETPGDQAELFPLAWLTTEPMRTVIATAPTGVALLKAVRNELGEVIDFHYGIANPIQRALAKHPEEDLLSQSLTGLSPDVLKTDMLTQLIQVVNSGRPYHHVIEYRMDGVVGRYDQVYVKSGDGVLMLVQDVTYSPLSPDERGQQTALLRAIERRHDLETIRSILLTLISGQVR